MRRCVPVAKVFKAEAVAVNDDRWNVEQGELQIRHVDAFRVHVDRGDVEVLLIIDAHLAHFVGEREDHGAAAGSRLLCCDESALSNARLHIRFLGDNNLGHHPTKRVGGEVLS